MNRISFHDMYVYPGCSAVVFFKIASDGTTVPVSVEFSDGSIATAEAEQVHPDEMLIRIDAYTTEWGTRIPKKTWRLRYDKGLDLWKVAARI